MATERDRIIDAAFKKEDRKKIAIEMADIMTKMNVDWLELKHLESKLLSHETRLDLAELLRKQFANAWQDVQTGKPDDRLGNLTACILTVMRLISLLEVDDPLSEEIAKWKNQLVEVVAANQAEFKRLGKPEPHP